MTRFVLISDTHGQHDGMPAIPDGDILIHAGDMTGRGEYAELSSVNTFFGKLPHKHKIFIAGNHDLCFEHNKEKARALIPDLTYLQDEAVELMGFRIYGSPWQPAFNNWAFNLPRGLALAQVWAKIPQGTNILITHGPPAGVADYSKYERTRVGCRELLLAIQRLKPNLKLHVFGHTHEGYGILERDGVIFANASTCTRFDYAPINKPLVIDL